MGHSFAFRASMVHLVIFGDLGLKMLLPFKLCVVPTDDLNRKGYFVRSLL